jgi:hypothetical protein
VIVIVHHLAFSTRMAAVRGLTGLLAALLLVIDAFVLPRPAAACTGSNTPVADPIRGTAARVIPTIADAPGACNAIAAGQHGVVVLAAEGLPDTATEPPGVDDPNRAHIDPGVWPLLVFIVAMFVFGLVVRGSRSRRDREDVAEPRHRR